MICTRSRVKEYKSWIIAFSRSFWPRIIIKGSLTIVRSGITIVRTRWIHEIFDSRLTSGELRKSNWIKRMPEIRKISSYWRRRARIGPWAGEAHLRLPIAPPGRAWPSRRNARQWSNWWSRHIRARARRMRLTSRCRKLRGCWPCWGRQDRQRKSSNSRCVLHSVNSKIQF